VPPLPSGSTVLVPELGPFFRSNDGVDADSGVTQLYTHLVPNGDGQAVVIIPFEASLALQMHREREREREREQRLQQNTCAVSKSSSKNGTTLSTSRLFKIAMVGLMPPFKSGLKTTLGY
jgi:hypothetical protein